MEGLMISFNPVRKHKQQGRRAEIWDLSQGENSGVFVSQHLCLDTHWFWQASLFYKLSCDYCYYYYHYGMLFWNLNWIVFCFLENFKIPKLYTWDKTPGHSEMKKVEQVWTLSFEPRSCFRRTQHGFTKELDQWLLQTWFFLFPDNILHDIYFSGVNLATKQNDLVPFFTGQ